MVLIFSLKNTFNGAAFENCKIVSHGEFYEGRNLEWAEKIARDYDTVINNMPALKLDAIGNSVKSAELETNKWATRWEAEKFWMLPPVLEECTFGTITKKGYCKAKGFPFSSFLNGKGTEEFPAETPAYVEQKIDAVPVSCTFTVCNGKYKIEGLWTRTGKAHPLDKNPVIKKCTSVDFYDKCVKWLDHISTFGGNYSGEIEAGIAEDGIYWYEQNSRRITGGQYHGTYQDWIESLTVDPTKAGNWTYK